MLTLPGASYLAGLSRINKLNYSTPETVLLVIGFNLVMLMLLEVPLLSFAIAPGWTVGAIDRAKKWIGRHGVRFAAILLVGLGILLVVKALVELLS
jgi:hypothetical protein